MHRYAHNCPPDTRKNTGLTEEPHTSHSPPPLRGWTGPEVRRRGEKGGRRGGKCSESFNNRAAQMKQDVSPSMSELRFGEAAVELKPSEKRSRNKNMLPVFLRVPPR